MLKFTLNYKWVAKLVDILNGTLTRIKNILSMRDLPYEPEYARVGQQANLLKRLVLLICLLPEPFQ